MSDLEQRVADLEARVQKLEKMIDPPGVLPTDELERLARGEKLSE